MTNPQSIEKTAKALIAHHGEDGAEGYCKERIQYHDQAKESEAANLWRAIGKAVGQVIAGVSRDGGPRDGADD